MSDNDDSLPFVVDLLRLLGNNTDAAGIATVFARLNQIAGYTDIVEPGINTILAQTDTLESVLGAAGDTIASATVNGRVLKLLALLGLTTDAAGTGTAFARLAQIAAFVDTVEPLLGTNADAPATNASMWAMLKTINAKPAGPLIDMTALTPFNKETSIASNGNTLIPLLSITGKGYISSFYMYTGGGATTGLYTIKMTIDGVVKMLLATSFASRYIGLTDKVASIGTATTSGLRIPNGLTIQNSIVGFKSYPITDSSDGIIILGDAEPIYFYQSLLLEVAGPVSPLSQTIGYIYQGGSL